MATVLEVGIAAIDTGTAKVFVAANTEVTSTSTNGQARTVPWRIELDMVWERGAVVGLAVFTGFTLYDAPDPLPGGRPGPIRSWRTTRGRRCSSRLPT